MLRRRITALLLLLAACDEDDVVDTQQMDSSVGLTRDAALDAAREEVREAGHAEHDAGPGPDARALDVLFVIDDSTHNFLFDQLSSIAFKQDALARELPRFVEGLLQGELDGHTFAPITSLHVGVVTSNVGGFLLGDTVLSPAGETCRGLGNDGLLQTSIDSARDGYIYTPSNSWLFPEPQVYQEADPACALGPQPRFQVFPGQGSTLALSCVARPGALGCAHEQTLESMWKALAPSAKHASDPLYQFAEFEGAGGLGQGDRGNQGFLREEATLAVIVMSDDDDCSLKSEGRVLLSWSSSEEVEKYGFYKRCEANPELLQPVERYARGLLSLKPGHPERILFTAITGVSVSAIERGLDANEILALDDMQVVTDAGFGGALCTVQTPWSKTEGNVYPGRRFVELAQAFGERAVLGTVCGDDYRAALARTAKKL